MFKKVMVVGLLLGSINLANASCIANGSLCWDESGTISQSNTTMTLVAPGPQLYSRTIAQIDASTPSASGLLVYCSDCVLTSICVSSGTGRGAYVAAASTSTATTTSIIPHCK